MQIVVNSEEMKEIDNYTIEKIGIPGAVLMERAALAIADAVKKYTESDMSPSGRKKHRILVVCGTGNNGADGIAAARILFMQGYEADILVTGNQDKASKLCKMQLNIAQNLGISIYSKISWDEYTIIIDAIFGVGLNREVRDDYRAVIECINHGEFTVFSIDIPSGLSSDTGKPQGIAVKAEYTITFGFYKTGQLLYPGTEYTGKLILADIGLINEVEHLLNTRKYTYKENDLEGLPKRYAYSNKGSYGKVLVVAGTVNVSGACYFSAKAAYRSGAGLVKVFTAEGNRTIIQTQLPEALLTVYQDEWKEETALNLLKELKWANVIVIGPGLGLTKVSKKLLESVIENAKVPVIIDADAITTLARLLDEKKYREIDGRIQYLSDILPEKTVLTPHLKELSKLMGCTIDDIKNDLLKAADICTKKNRIRIVIKDARTIVAGENNRYINLSGNQGMATGGTGDVLTGIIAAFIAQGLPYSEAAELGVYIHGLAGDKAKEEKGCYSLIASDVIEMLPTVLKWRNI